jgi:murein DD-endopeptidase MepM/ murein hydrolase activator NlpD
MLRKKNVDKCTMRYHNDNLAAYIPQRVSRRRGKKSSKKQSVGFWAELQAPAKRRPDVYRVGAYVPAGGGFSGAAGGAQSGLRDDQAGAGVQNIIEEKSASGFFLLKVLLVVLLVSALAIFSYNALLWQRDYDALTPAVTAVDDGLAAAEMHNYVWPVQSPAGESDEIPLPMTEMFSWTDYKVLKGDSVSKIAASYDLSMDAVIASNNIVRARALREGETLRIPNMDGIPITVRRNDTLGNIGAQYGVPVTAILDANDLESETLTEGSTLFIPGAKMSGEDLRAVIGDIFIYPVRGRLSSPFGWRSDPINGERRYHAAIDLAANQGTPVKAAMDGRVSSVGFNSTYGNYIIITHSGGYQTMYAHLSAVGVENGKYVVQGKEIGKVGSTGYSTGPHLHFAIYKNNRALNPLDYLKF